LKEDTLFFCGSPRVTTNAPARGILVQIAKVLSLVSTQTNFALRMHQRQTDVGKYMSKRNGLADPTRLKPLNGNNKHLLRVVIETPKGSRNKFAQLRPSFDSGDHFHPNDQGYVASGNEIPLALFNTHKR
jgi:lysophospholipase L1-like esterase